MVKQVIPLSDSILDDDFFRSKPLLDFNPLLSMGELQFNCHTILQLVQAEQQDNDLNFKRQQSFTSLQSADQGKIYKIQKLQQVLQNIVQEGP